MQKWLVLAVIALSANADLIDEDNDSHTCHENIGPMCKNTTLIKDSSVLKCHAKYGGVGQDLFNTLDRYISQHITTSFQYLLMSSNFKTYRKNRDGFAKLFRKLSDETWEDALDLVKYTTKRGGSVDWKFGYSDPLAPLKVEMGELDALSRALDMHKNLAQESHDIHRKVINLERKTHDAEVASYIEKEFVHKHASTIRDLAGHNADVLKFVKVPRPGLSIFVFDEYLQKVVA